MSEPKLDNSYLADLYADLLGETGEKVIGKQTLLHIVELALMYNEITSSHNLWGHIFPDNNKVDAHNVFETKSAAILKSWEMSMKPQIVPLYYPKW